MEKRIRLERLRLDTIDMIGPESTIDIIGPETFRLLKEVGFEMYDKADVFYLPINNIPKFVDKTGYSGEVDFLNKCCELTGVYRMLRFPASSEYWKKLVMVIRGVAKNSCAMDELIITKGFDQVIQVRDFVNNLAEEAKKEKLD